MSYHDSFSKAFEAASERQKFPDFTWCLGTSVNAELDGAYLPFYSRLIFGVGEPPTPRESLQYEKVELWEGLIDPAATMAYLQGNGEPAPKLGRAGLEKSTCVWDYQPPTDWWPRWLQLERCHYLRHEVERKKGYGFFRDLLLSRPGGPSFVGFYSALKYWMHLDVHHGDSDVREWHIEVLLPLAPGCVRSAKEAGECLNVQLVPGANNADLEVQLAWEEDNVQDCKKASPTDDKAVFDVAPLGEFSLFVLSGGNLIDCYRHRGLERLGERATGEGKVSIAALTAGGENEQCEFKEAPSDDPKNWKSSFWAHVLKAVIAFANTHGGHVLLGVTDTATPEGLAPALKQLGNRDVAEGRKPFEALVRKRLQDALVDAPEILFFWEELGGAPILVIRVSRNQGGVTCDLYNNIYIRKGSTCRRPSTDELRSLLVRDDSALR